MSARRGAGRRRADEDAGSGDVGTGSGVGGGELSADELAALRADDRLLDALGRGEPVTRDDQLAELLGAWRAEMDTEPLPSVDVLAVTAAQELEAEPFAVDGFIADRFAAERLDLDAVGYVSQAHASAAQGSPLRPALAEPPGTAGAAGNAGTAPGGRAGRSRPGDSRSKRWPRGLRLGLAAALLVAAAGGVSITANAAGPDGPLWSVVRLVDPGRADVREAQDSIDKARKAAAERRYDDARRLVEKADTQVARVQDPQQQARLRAELDAVRRSLPGLTGIAPGTAPGAPGQTGPSSATPGQAGTAAAPGGTQPAQAGTGGGTPGSTPTQGAPLLPPILPPLLPSPSSSPAPLPLPTCILGTSPLGLPLCK